MVLYGPWQNKTVIRFVIDLTQKYVGLIKPIAPRLLCALSTPSYFCVRSITNLITNIVSPVKQSVCLPVRLFTLCPGHISIPTCPIWIFHTIIAHDLRVCHDLDPRSYPRLRSQYTYTQNPCPGHNSSVESWIWITFHTIVVQDPRVCHDFDTRSRSQCTHTKNPCPDHNHTGIFKGCGYSSRLWLQFLKDVATGKNGRFAREFSVSPQLMRISLKLCYIISYKVCF